MHFSTMLTRHAFYIPTRFLDILYGIETQHESRPLANIPGHRRGPSPPPSNTVALGRELSDNWACGDPLLCKMAFHSRNGHFAAVKNASCECSVRFCFPEHLCKVLCATCTAGSNDWNTYGGLDVPHKFCGG